MNNLSPHKQVEVIKCLLEGNSIRGTGRITGIAKATILSLLVRLGIACQSYLDTHLVGLPCKTIQCDELWTFCHTKRQNLIKPARGHGDIWVWVAICSKTKLVITHRISPRNLASARLFIRDLSTRVSLGDERLHLTTDGLHFYTQAVKEVYCPQSKIDYAQIVKVYRKTRNRVYPSVEFIIEQRVLGDPQHSSTSFVERNNLTMRTSLRRLARRTNAHSKKLENLGHAVALHLMYYNFCRIHSSIKTTPAKALGIAKHHWDIYDLLGLIN